MKHITLCICVCSSPLLVFLSALYNWNIGEFGAKKYFIDHQTGNAIQLFVPLKRKFFRSLLFQSKLPWGVIPQGLLDKYSYLFISISLKWTLGSGQKPVYTVKILVSEQIAFAAVLYFRQVFVFSRLINRGVLEWFLLIMCK